MAGPSDDETFSPEIQRWELEHARLVALRFSGMDVEDLAAELAVTILELKRNPPPNIRQWKAYLTQALFHRATQLARQHRRRIRHEVLLLPSLDVAEPPAHEKSDIAPPNRQQLLRRLRRLLDSESVKFVVNMMESKFNHSLLASVMGVHRNTVRRRWRVIQSKLRKCPIEMYSAAPDSLILTPSQRADLTRIVDGPQPLARRAKIILALADGVSYRWIESTYHATPRTIALWKSRFETAGLSGLRSARRRGAHRQFTGDRLRRWLERNRTNCELRKWSCRHLARRFGLSKSTVHRILASISHSV